MTTPPYRRFLASKLLTYLAVAVVMLGVYLYIEQVRTEHRASQAAQHAISLANQGKASPAPATVKPSVPAIDTYHVAPTHPRYLLIPKLNLKARVFTTGITKDHAIGTPANVYDTAWYTGSSEPGQSGATLIDGHVSSWKTHGVFYNLQSLRAGDSITIQLGSNKQLTYRVVKTQIYDSNDVDVQTLLTPIDKDTSGLNLITCTGDVIKGTNDFKQRVVVYASQI